MAATDPKPLVAAASNGFRPSAGRETDAAPAAHGPGAALAAPVIDDGATRSAGSPVGDISSGAAHEVPRTEAGRPERVTAVLPDAADSAGYRPAHADTGTKTFDVATTRRRPVVFEEDDDLDVPDFLK